MSKFLSGRQAKLNLGVPAYTENKTVLQTTGKVGIGTTDAQSYSLFVVGDTNIVGHAELDQLRVSGVSTFQSDIHFGDNDTINMGDNDDFQIFHHSNGTGIIQNAGSGQLQIRSNEIRLLNQATDEDYAFFRDDGAVELYYDNSKKFETTGIGVSIYNDLNVGTAVTVYGNAGIVSAISFYGDGANLTNTGATLAPAASTQRVVLTSLTSGTMVDAATDSDLTYNAATDTLNVDNLIVAGNLTVDGDQTILNVTQLEVEDINIGIASASTKLNNAQLDGAGITIHGSQGDKTLTWDNSNSRLGFNTDLYVPKVETGHAQITGGISTDGYDTGNQFELMRADGNGGWAWATVPGIFSVNNILNGFNVYEEGLVVGTAGSIHTLDFRGINVTASAAPQPNGIATVTFSTRPSFDETYVTGLSTTGRLIVSGISTFNGEIDANGRIVAAATNNVIPFLYSNLGDLPSAVSFHGAFAHVHGTGKAYYAHAANWYELVNKDLNGTVGTGTERYNIGPVDLTTLDVSGISTFAGLVDINGGGQANTFKVEDLTDNRVVIAGTGGELEDDANLTFDGSKFNVGSAITAYAATGIVSATAFYGDGSNLLNTGATLSAASGLQRLVVTDLTSGTMVDAATDGDLTFNASNNSLAVPNINVSVGATFGGTITAGSSEGVVGQYLRHVGTGVTWANFPTLRTTSTNTATAGQTTFNFTYNTDFLDVFVNGVKLSASEYTATNGSQIVLNTPAFADEIVEFHSYNTASTYGGGGGGSYGNSDVDNHLNVSGASSGQILSWNGSDYAWVADQTGGSGITTAIINADTIDSGSLNVSGVSTFTTDKVFFKNGGTPSPATLQIETGVAGVGNTIRSSNSLDLVTNGSSFKLELNTTNAIIAGGTGAAQYVQLYGAGSEKLKTIGTGVTVTGTTFSNQLSVSGISTFNGKTRLLDDVEFHVGTNGSSGDYKFYRDSSNTRNILYEDISGAEARFISNISGDSNAAFHFFKGSNALARFSVNNAQLHSGGAVKFETTSTGATVTGTLAATSFSGSGSSLTGLTGASAATYGGASVSPQITVDANGRITSITNVSIAGGGGGGGSNIIVQDSQSLVGAAGTIDFGTGLSVSAISAGIATVTAAGISTAIINADTIDSGSLNVSGISTFSNGLTVPAQQTIATGANFTLSSNSTGNLTELRHSGSNNTLRYRSDNHQFMNEAATTTRMSIGNDGVSLNHDNIPVLKTVGAGVTIGIPNYPATLFTNQFSVSGISTFASGLQVPGGTGVSNRIELGNSQEFTLQYNTATTKGIISAAANPIEIQATTIKLLPNVGENGVIVNQNGSVELYHDNVKKFETTNTGVTITGTASATTFSGSGASLTTLNASELDSGTIPDARFPATLPAVSGANLTNLPAPTPADTDVQATFDISSNGSSAYRFTGPGNSGSDDNPDLYLVRGQRYRFINGTGSSHPFEIRVSNGGSAYTDGITGSTSGTQDFNVQHDAPARLYYQCTVHSGMVGTIYIIGGDQVIPDNEKITFGNGDDLQIYHDGSNSVIKDNGTGKLIFDTDGAAIEFQKQGLETIATFNSDGAVELYHDNSKKFETTSYGAQFTDNVKFDNPDTAGRDLTWEADNDALHWEDNTKATFGGGNDLQIYHDGSHSYVLDNGTGDLRLASNGVTAITKGDTEMCAGFNVDGAVELYYDNSKKFETTSTGVSVTGNIAIANGNGIDFSATANSYGSMGSELLDDYEEGTWTPVINKSGVAGTAGTPSTGVGYYRKVGKLLWISFYWYKGSGGFGNNAGEWYVSGLPYLLAHNTGGAYQFIPGGYNNINGTNYANQSNRWQSNNTNGSATLAMYGPNSTTNWTSGYAEFAASGCLMVP